MFPKKECQYPMSMREIGKAMLIVRENAEEWLVDTYFGNRAGNEELFEETSPARNITENTPPVFLWATAEDQMVPVQHSILMAKALADKKIPFEMHIFEKGSHGLSIATQASAGSRREINEDVAKWMELCDAWLMKRFALELPEKRDWVR